MRGPEARATFIDSHLSKGLAFQLRSLREQQNWNQGKLADKVKMNQNAISRLENPFYGKATITTLKRIAAAFDVALIIRFVPFSQLVNWVSGTPYTELGLSPDSMCLPNFEEEHKHGLFENMRLPERGQIVPPKLSTGVGNIGVSASSLGSISESPSFLQGGGSVAEGAMHMVPGIGTDLSLGGLQ